MRRGLWLWVLCFALLTGCSTPFPQKTKMEAIGMSNTKKPDVTVSASAAIPTPSPTPDAREQAILSIDQKLEKLGMVDLSRLGMDWLIDVRYAGEDNFVGRQMYPSRVSLLTQGSAQKLIKAQQLFEKQGYRLKIWDAYRPSAYQQFLYDAADDKSFVANPARGSKHSRGAAVDVTLVDETGAELLMPTAFDAFVPQASLDSELNIGEAKANGVLLRDTMIAAGFQPISSEWWHFDDTQWENYPLTDYNLADFEVPQ